MALVFTEGFDAYSTNIENVLLDMLANKWGTSTGTGFQGGQTPRTAGGYAINIGNSDITTPYFNSHSTWIVGFGHIIGIANADIIRFNDGGTTQCKLYLNSGRFLELRNGNNTILATGTTQLAVSTWYHIEVKAVINNTSGSMEVRLNEVLEASATSVDTTQTANDTANNITLRINNGGQGYFDDLFICDGSGSTNNDFLGDMKIETLFPTGAGNYTQWTPLSGSNFENVDEVDIDDDTTYNSTSTANNIDTYTMADLSAIVSDIKGVVGNLMVRKDAAGSKTTAPMFRISATDYQGTTASDLDSYRNQYQVYETNPDTATAWTVSDVNNAEFGIKLVS